MANRCALDGGFRSRVGSLCFQQSECQTGCHVFQMLEETMKQKILLFSIVLLLPVISLSQQKLSLTIEQAIQAGLEKSKALHTSQFKLQAADAKASETNHSGLPSLKLNGVYTRLSTVPPEAVTLPANSFGPGFPPADVAMTLSPTILNNYTCAQRFSSRSSPVARSPARSMQLLIVPGHRAGLSQRQGRCHLQH